MGFTERVYSVLVVSASEKLNSALSELLPESHFQTVRTVSSVSAARRAWDERSYDFVIINSPLPDDAGIRFAVDLGNTSGAAVLLLVRAELHEDIGGKVAENGVFTLPRPLSRPVLMLTLGFMAASRERLRRFEKKTLSFEEKMEEIRLVTRAKWVLINELKMDEPQAHRYIEKQAMDRCVPRRRIAEEIIQTYG